MKRFLPCLLLTAAVCASCGGFSVKGYMPDQPEGDTIVINVINYEGNLEPVSYAILKNGRFSTKVDIPQEDIAVLSFINEGQEQAFSFFLEKGTATISLQDGVLSLGGTPANNGLQTLNDRAQALNDESSELMEAIQKAYQENPDATEQYRTDVEALQEQYVDLIMATIRSNADNLCGLYQLVENFNIFTPEESKEMLDCLADKYSDNEMYCQMLSLTEDKLLTSVGNKYMDISVITQDDKELKLSSVLAENKVVLLDFWASWCNPCVNEIPYLKEAYSKYHKLGFEILSVSLDEEDSEWRAALKQHKMPWIQALDNDVDENSAAYIYRIDAIPTSFLINSDGIIIASNLRGDALDKTLAKFFE